MTDHQQLQRLAALAVLHDLTGKALNAAKTTLGRQLGRGTLTAFVDPTHPETSEVLGVLTMPRPTQPSPRIVDEQLALVWAIKQFGEIGTVEARLTEQGRKSVIAAAKKGAEIPGVEIPAPRPASPRFTQTPEAASEVAAMWRRGDLKLTDVLAIDAPKETK